MKIIVWDIDDVLNDLTKEWFTSFSLDINITCSLKFEDLKENPPHNLLGITEEFYIKSLDKFRKEQGHKLKPLMETLSWFERKGDRYFHIALTATPFFYVPLSAEWLFNNYGKWFNSFNFVPSKREGDGYRYRFSTKLSLIKLFRNIDAFIDDNESNIEDVSTIGVKTFLFPRPWNKSQYSSVNEFFEDLDRFLAY